VLVAPQHFQRIPELVMGLKALSSRHGTLPYNTQIFAGISSLIALEISSSRKTTFYTHVKKALGKQPLHAAKHKQARDIVNGYYDNTDSFAALPTATFRLIFGASIATRRRFKLCTIGSTSDAIVRQFKNIMYCKYQDARALVERAGRLGLHEHLATALSAWNTELSETPWASDGEDLPSMSARPKAK